MEQDEKQILSRRLAEDLENLERYIEELSAFLPLAICTVNPVGIIVGINQATKDLAGYNEEDIIGQGIEILFKDEKLTREFIDQVLDKGLVKDQEMVLLTQDKKEITVSISGAARKDNQGNIIGSFLAISDITQIKKSQEDLEEKVKERTARLEEARKALTNMLEDAEGARKKIEEERNKTRATLTSLTDGLIVFDQENKINLINPAAEKILGLKEGEVINRTLDQISDFPNLVKLYDALGKKVEWTGQEYEVIFEKPFKRFFQVSITPSVVDKEVMGMIVILHDISREKEIDRLKNEFVSIAAHQLRTPLSAIKWSLRLVLDGDTGKITKKQAEILEKGYQSNERMITLINDLLNVARIEEGRFVYKAVLSSIEEIITKSIDNLNSLANRKRVKIVFNKPLGSLPKVNVDKEKIMLVIQNLIDNAIRFNKSNGEVTVSVKRDKINIEVVVKDNGIGIPSVQKDRIFTKFFRADNAIISEAEGSGLGLFICKNIIEAHGGRIWFESEKGQGTAFYFTLPAAIAKKGDKFKEFIEGF